MKRDELRSFFNLSFTFLCFLRSFFAFADCDTSLHAIGKSSFYSSASNPYSDENYQKVFFETPRVPGFRANDQFKEIVPAWVLATPLLSDVASNLGVVSLKHQLRGASLSDAPETVLWNILKTGKLDARKATGRAFDNPKGSQFLTLNTKPTINNAHLMPVIEFSNRILDRNDYYLNQGWDHGVYSDRSIRFDEIERIRKFLYRFSSDFLQHEVVVWGPISTSEIIRINLSTEMRALLLNRLITDHIPPPIGRNWEAILVVSPMRINP